MSALPAVTPSNAITTAVTRCLEFEVGKAIIDLFDPLHAKACELVAQGSAISVTDATQVTEIKAARAARLKIRAVRLEAENSRKTAGEAALKRKQAIDGAARVIVDMCDEAERRLEELEKFAERAEAARKKALAESRAEALRAYPDAYRPDLVVLAGMTEDDWTKCLEGAKTAQEAADDRRRKAEEERKAADAQRAADAEKARAALAEANERAAKDRAAREESDRKAREEREAREKLEREAQEREAQARAQREREAAEARRLAAAPDATKLRVYAEQLLAVPMPECTTDEGRGAVERIRGAIGVFVSKINQTADQIGGGR